MQIPLANGISIACETQGDPRDPPLLLIMGLGMQLISWPQAFVDGLVEQGFYVIRYDNRDCGLSTRLEHLGTPNLPLMYLKSRFGWKVGSGYTLDDMAGDALGLLDALGIAQVHVLGLSMGGMIAQLIAARHPQRVSSLVSMMSSSGRRGLPGPTPAARRALMQRPKKPGGREQVVQHMMYVARTIGSPAYPSGDALLRQRVERFLARASDTGNNAAGVARQMAAIAASGERTALLKTIRCPTMVIHGAADPLIPVACGIDTAALIPQAALQIIEGMGHDLPAQLIERLLALIDVHRHGKMTPQTRSQLA